MQGSNLNTLPFPAFLGPILPSLALHFSVNNLHRLFLSSKYAHFFTLPHFSAHLRSEIQIVGVPMMLRSEQAELGLKRR